MNASGNGSGNGGGSVNGLFRTAQAEGTLSPTSYQALTCVDLGAQIQAGLGISVDDVQSSEIVLLSMMPDDSGSIQHAGNAQAVRDGHNAVLDALSKSKQAEAILAHTRYLNGHLLFPYCPIASALKMTEANYTPNQGTPLYDETVVLLGTVLAKSQELAQNGVATRSVTLLITDGSDQHSTRAQAKDVAALVRDMARAESHVVAAMGIDDGTTDFRRVFREMGIEDRWILTPRSDAAEIRKAFQVFSQSAVRMSQAASPGQASLRGWVSSP